MAARFEALSDDLVIEANIDPELRTAFISEWQKQRAVFGYSLFAEMPWYAYEMLIDHPEVDLGGLEILVVDEYQDLNACELRLVAALSGHGVSVIAVGDDEQSIYSWRMADPAGIRRFVTDYPKAVRFELTEARRFGQTILDISQDLIATSPNRDPLRSPITAMANADPGVFSYLRFADEHDESDGIVRIVQHYVESGVEPERIAVLSRSDFHGNWTASIREGLGEIGVATRNIRAAADPLRSDDARTIIACARLLMDEKDDLAWWTLLKLQAGCTDEYIRGLADSAFERGQRFHQVIQIHNEEPPAGTTRSRNAVQDAIDSIDSLRREIADVPEEGSFLDLSDAIARIKGLNLDDDYVGLVYEIEKRLKEQSPDLTLTDLLGQLEPVARDLALEAGGVAVMTIAGSKGADFRRCDRPWC